MKVKPSHKAPRYNIEEIFEIFVERKLVSPTVHKNKKRFDKKKERQRRVKSEL